MKRIMLTVVGIVLMLNLFSCNSSQTRFGKERHIELRAKRYAYTPNVIKVNKGDRIILKLISEDVTHGFFLDGYGIEFYVHPGETREVAIKADKAGKFIFRCSKTCGEFHPYMVGYLKVGPNSRYFAGIFLGRIKKTRDHRYYI